MVTSEDEEWEPKAAATPPASVVEQLSSLMLRIIGLASGLPPHEIGAEQDVNRNTATETRAVSMFRAKRVQRMVRNMLQTWFEYAVLQKYWKGQINYKRFTIFLLDTCT